MTTCILFNANDSSLDAQFKVFGSTGSLLSVSLSALQNLYTRRGTLVALNGQAKDVIDNYEILYLQY